MQGVKYDENKPRWSLLPIRPVTEIVRVLTYGSVKYADDNWKHVDNFRDRYYSALMRHLTAWWAGEIQDPETGYNHLAHAGCCLLFLLWKDLTNATTPN